MTRVQLELSEEKVSELETLMKELGIKTKVELINNAMTLFKWAVKERKSGRIIASVNSDRNVYKELLLPVIEEAAPKLTEEGVTV